MLDDSERRVVGDALVALARMASAAGLVQVGVQHPRDAAWACREAAEMLGSPIQVWTVHRALGELLDSNERTGS